MNRLPSVIRPFKTVLLSSIGLTLGALFALPQSVRAMSLDDSSCASGQTTFALAETTHFLVSVCGQSAPSTYIGKAKDGSGSITLPLSSYTEDTFTARNGAYAYTLSLTQGDLTIGLPDKKQVDNPVLEALVVAPKPDIHQPFKATASTLQAIAQFPVRLPTVIPDSPIGGSTPLYMIAVASAHHYKAILAYEPTCSGANFCTHFAVSGTDKQGLAQGELDEPHHTGQQVALTNGITGYFYESISGDSDGGNKFLDWEQDGIVYQVVTRAYPLLPGSALIRAANSTILGRS